MDKLEVAYAKATPEERAEAQHRLIEEKAKHRVAAVATALCLALFSLALEKVLPEA